MRIICGDCVVAIQYAKCEGKHLVFIASGGMRFRTDDYFSENIAYCKLNDLAVNGYIRLDEEHIKEDF